MGGVQLYVAQKANGSENDPPPPPNPPKKGKRLQDIKWKLRVKILGIYFSNSIPASEIDDNWLPRKENIQRTIVTWSKRNCSIMGKICIVKSLLLLQIIFALVAPADIIKKLNTLFF